MRILVVEDDETLAEFISKGLREAGYVVDVTGDGRSGLEAAALRRPDLAVVDLNLPGLDGFSLIESLRQRGLRFPVLILSARRSVDDRVRGLHIGGDDFLTKPFAFAELLARVQALLRRVPGNRRADSAARRRPGHRSPRPDGHPRRPAHRSCVPREYALLEYLARHAEPGRLEDDDPVADLELQLRSAHQRRRRARAPPARENRRGLRTQAPAHAARHGIRAGPRRPSRRDAACALWGGRLSRSVGLRVAAWYALLFVVSSTAVGVLGYRLLESSLVARDHDLLRVKLADYAARYESGGLRALSGVVEAEQASGDPDSVMVRLLAANADVVLLSPSPIWRAYDLTPLDGPGGEIPRRAVSPTRDTTIEVVSRVLWDGTLMQVGRTTVGREQVLREVRRILGVMLMAIVSAALAGGIVLTRQALKPMRHLLDTVRGIAETGQLTARVDTDDGGDMVDELGRVFNTMLARIETLVGGMRGALDNVAHDLRTPVARLRARAEAALASERNSRTGARGAGQLRRGSRPRDGAC